MRICPQSNKWHIVCTSYFLNTPNSPCGLCQSFITLFPYLRMSEPPFRPREKIIEKQKYFHRINKPTYLKGPYDKITSVAIPLALAVASTYMIAQGIYNMAHGKGKKDML